MFLILRVNSNQYLVKDTSQENLALKVSLTNVMDKKWVFINWNQWFVRFVVWKCKLVAQKVRFILNILNLSLEIASIVERTSSISNLY